MHDKMEKMPDLEAEHLMSNVPTELIHQVKTGRFGSIALQE